MKKELVYSYLDEIRIYAERQSNQTILVKKYKLIDSDSSIITDTNGYRYARNSIDLEIFCEGYYIYNMIQETKDERISV